VFVECLRLRFVAKLESYDMRLRRFIFHQEAIALDMKEEAILMSTAVCLEVNRDDCDE
jgi:hypothetical protein